MITSNIRSNLSETKRAIWAAVAGLALGAAAVGSVAVCRMHHHAAAESTAAAELAPDPAVLHYRYPTSKPSGAMADEASTITALEITPSRP